MQELFTVYLEISLCISPIVLLFYVISPILHKNYTPRMCHNYWLLIGISFLIPVRFIISQVAKVIPPTLFYTDRSDIIDRLNGTADSNKTSLLLQQISNNESASSVINSLSIIWAIGCITILVYHIIAYFITVRRLKRWSIPILNSDMTNIFEKVKEEYSIRNRIDLFQTKEITSPMILGLIYTSILIPTCNISNQESLHVLKHELCHYVRKDLWFKLLLLIVTILHWYNPIIYILARQSETNMELACDSDVLRNADSTLRKQYGLTILSFVGKSKKTYTPLTSCFYGGKKIMTKRFFSMVDASRKRNGLILCLILTLSLLTFSTYFGAKVYASLPEISSNTPRDSNDMTWPVPGFYFIEKSAADISSGIAIISDQGSMVIAANDGVVSYVNSDHQPGLGYGKHIVINHGNGIETLYGHLSDVNVKLGDIITRGQHIGNVGSTGYADEPHLQFEVRENGEIVDASVFVQQSN